MWKNSQFNDIIALVFDRRLGKALNLLENYLLSHQHQDGLDQLLQLKNEYQLLLEYWCKGFNDPQREQLYNQLLRRMYVLATNVAIHDRMRDTPFLLSAYQRPRRKHQDWELATLRYQLEDYVSNVAMLQLEPEHTRQQKGEAVYRDHQQLLNDLFDYIWTSRLWADSLATAVEELLLSPTIDQLDQQLMVSAIMLSAMNAFGINKFRLLVNVYQKATYEPLRQRALVGWVMCADAEKLRLYPEMHEMVQALCREERVRTELTELQMQMMLCMNAEDDTKTIKDEIIPDLMKGQNLRMTHQGLVEQDEDALENILHPEASEQNMERMEQSIHKMVDMQKKGSDIYFAGFSQMKRFPFFNDISNWFMPFYAHHPAISSLWSQTKGQRFLHTIMKLGAFCDSDKYSFVLAFSQVLARLPKQMLEMVEHGEAMPMPVGGEVAIEEQRQPAFVRRLYLQNLYRFFRLYSLRSEFVNPFSMPRAVFFASPLFRATALEQHMPEVASFLTKRHHYAEAKLVLENMSSKYQDASYHVMMGNLLLRTSDKDMHAVASAYEHFFKASKLEPDNAKALMGFARTCFARQQYSEAVNAYEKLLQLQPDSKSVQLNMAVCLSNLKRYEEALKLLYKLNYLYPDDESVMRVLAWTLTADGKYEQSVKLYDRLLSVSQPDASDLLNYGYCLWFSGNVQSAVSMLRQFLTTQQDASFSIEHEFLHTEHDLLLDHGISDTDILLMLDSLG